MPDISFYTVKITTANGVTTKVPFHFMESHHTDDSGLSIRMIMGYYDHTVDDGVFKTYDNCGYYTLTPDNCINYEEVRNIISNFFNLAWVCVNE